MVDAISCCNAELLIITLLKTLYINFKCDELLLDVEVFTGSLWCMFSEFGEDRT
jgi:hypothetical protein